MAMSIFPLKLAHNGVLRRLKLSLGKDGAPFQALQDAIAVSFPEIGDVNIQFVDDEDDTCTITNDQELVEARDVSLESGKTTLKLYLEAKHPCGPSASSVIHMTKDTSMAIEFGSNSLHSTVDETPSENQSGTHAAQGSQLGLTASADLSTLHPSATSSSPVDEMTVVESSKIVTIPNVSSTSLDLVPLNVPTPSSLVDSVADVIPSSSPVTTETGTGGDSPNPLSQTSLSPTSQSTDVASRSDSQRATAHDSALASRRAELRRFSVRKLKQLIADLGLSIGTCVEKDEFIRFILDAEQPGQPEHSTEQSSVDQPVETKTDDVSVSVSAFVSVTDLQQEQKQPQEQEQVQKQEQEPQEFKQESKQPSVPIQLRSPHSSAQVASAPIPHEATADAEAEANNMSIQAYPTTTAIVSDCKHSRTPAASGSQDSRPKSADSIRVHTKSSATKLFHNQKPVPAQSPKPSVSKLSMNTPATSRAQPKRPPLPRGWARMRVPAGNGARGSSARGTDQSRVNSVKSHQKLRPGLTVHLHGLQAAPHYNGLSGHVSKLQRNGRVLVRVAHEGQVKLLNVHPRNLLQSTPEIVVARGCARGGCGDSCGTVKPCGRLGAPTIPARTSTHSAAHPSSTPGIVPSLHRGVSCSQCAVSPIQGTRFHCTVCQVDLCTSCEANTTHPLHHPLLQLRVAPSPPAPSPRRDTHHVRCDGCHRFPIVGPRYTCLTCADYDLCAACEAKHEHPATHPFLKLRLPMQHQTTEPQAPPAVQDSVRIVPVLEEQTRTSLLAPLARPISTCASMSAIHDSPYGQHARPRALNMRAVSRPTAHSTEKCAETPEMASASDIVRVLLQQAQSKQCGRDRPSVRAQQQQLALAQLQQSAASLRSREDLNLARQWNMYAGRPYGPICA